MRLAVLSGMFAVLISATSHAAANRVGDADNSGSLNATDAALVQARVLGVVDEWSISPLALADGDSDVDLSDILLVAQAATGQRVISGPGGWLSFVDPGAAFALSGGPPVPLLWGVYSSFFGVAENTDGLGVGFTKLPGTAQSTLAAPTATVTGLGALAQLNPLNTTGGAQNVTVRMTLAVQDSSGASLSNHIRNAIVNVSSSNCGNGVIDGGEACDDGASNGQPNQCDVNCTGITPRVCGNGVSEGAPLTIATLEWVSTNCGAGDLEIDVNGTPLFDTPMLGTGCTCGDAYQTVSTGSPALLAAFVNGVNNITLRINPAGGGALLAWAILTVDNGLGPQSFPLWDGNITWDVMFYSPEVCNFSLTDNLNFTSPHNVSLTEGCDDGDNDNCTPACNASCSGPYALACGDGVAECEEFCDDGFQTECGVCNATCTATGSGGQACGDGISCPDAGEICDDGLLNGTCDACSPNCRNTIQCGVGLFLSVSADGFLHTCGVRANNTVACWGWNSIGQSTPPGGTFLSVSAGYWHNCGVRTDNTVACRGAGMSITGVSPNYGQSIPPAGAFLSVSAGSYHTCGVRTDNTLGCWGYNGYGQSTPPGGAFLSVSAGGYQTCGVRTDNTVACWGDNSYGESTPPGGAFLSVSAGGSHTCGVRADNTAACWGYNGYGQSTPPGGAFLSISAGGSHTCGVRTDNTVACWGYNGSGQAMPPGGAFLSVSAGGYHTCGLQADDTVACWGYNSYGQSTPP